MSSGSTPTTSAAAGSSRPRPARRRIGDRDGVDGIPLRTGSGWTAPSTQHRLRRGASRPGPAAQRGRDGARRGDGPVHLRAARVQRNGHVASSARSRNTYDPSPCGARIRSSAAISARACSGSARTSSSAAMPYIASSVNASSRRSREVRAVTVASSARGVTVVSHGGLLGLRCTAGGGAASETLRRVPGPGHGRHRPSRRSALPIPGRAGPSAAPPRARAALGWRHDPDAAGAVLAQPSDRAVRRLVSPGRVTARSPGVAAWPRRVPSLLRTGVPVSVTDELLANNARYAESFSGPLPLPPAKHVAVVACMDARLNVYGILGLAGGRGARHPQRRRRRHRRRDPLARDQPAAAGHPRDHPDPPHRLRDADLHRRRVQEVGSRTRPGSSRRGPPRRSPTSTRTSASRSPGSRRARSSRTPTQCAGSSSTSRPASSTRS